MAGRGSGTAGEMTRRRPWQAAWLTLGLCGVAVGSPREVVTLWPQGAPGAQQPATAETLRVTEQGERVVSNVHAPSITVYLPVKSGGAVRTAGSGSTGVVVIPGGGHVEIWMDHEGYNVAAYLAAHGIAAFVLKYRLARAPGSAYTVEGSALADVQRAIRLVRTRSAEWHVDPNRIGVMGFSAGGELAALAATRYGSGDEKAADPIDRLSSRPAFEALIYPAIPHDMRLSKETPPTFLLAGADDAPAISQGVATLYLSLRQAGVPAELHLYDGVGHGFGLRFSNAGPVSEWPRQFVEWLVVRGL